MEAPREDKESLKRKVGRERERGKEKREKRKGTTPPLKEEKGRTTKRKTEGVNRRSSFESESERKVIKKFQTDKRYRGAFLLKELTSASVSLFPEKRVTLRSCFILRACDGKAKKAANHSNTNVCGECVS